MAIERVKRYACVDRVIPSDYRAEAAALAIAENPANGIDEGAPGQKIALERRKLWKNGRTLRVRFLDGTPSLQEKVKKYALVWTDHANLSFDFTRDSRAEIRISFGFDPGSSWSALGTDALVDRYFPRHEPTMNFGWLNDSTPDDEVSRVTLHEFGHAIGCIHEHQNPEGGIEWNEQAVLDYFSGPPNYWDEAAIRFNILNRYSLSQICGTEFDPDSIMLYSFPASLTLNGVATHENTKLSKMDIEFIEKVYPKPQP